MSEETTNRPIPILTRLADELRDLRITVQEMREENAKLSSASHHMEACRAFLDVPFDDVLLESIKALKAERDHYEAQFMALRSFLGNASRIWYNMNDDLQAKYKAALGEKLGQEENP